MCMNEHTYAYVHKCCVQVPGYICSVYNQDACVCVGGRGVGEEVVVFVSVNVMCREAEAC